MSHLNEFIVYLWLLPVSFHVLLPLLVLACWLVTKIPASLARKPASNEIGEARATAA